MLLSGLPTWPFYGQISKIWPFFRLVGHRKKNWPFSQIWPFIWPFSDSLAIEKNYLAIFNFLYKFGHFWPFFSIIIFFFNILRHIWTISEKRPLLKNGISLELLGIFQNGLKCIEVTSNGSGTLILSELDLTFFKINLF